MMTTSLSIRPSLSCNSPNCSSSSSSFSLSCYFPSHTPKPICWNLSKTRSLASKVLNSKRVFHSFKVKPCKMAISELSQSEEEEIPILEDAETSRPRRIALFVEPSPFALVSFKSTSSILFVFFFFTNNYCCNFSSVDYSELVIFFHFFFMF